MKNNWVVSVGVYVLIFSSCIRLSDYRDKNLMSKILFTYEYHDEQLISITEKEYTYEKGRLTDSLTKHTACFYDENDSLRYLLELHNKGDTLLWEAYEGFPEGRKVIASYHSQNMFNTLPYRGERLQYKYDYVNDECVKKSIFDSTCKVVGEVYFKYGDGIPVQEKYFSINDSIQSLIWMKTYDYSKSRIFYDFYYLNNGGDTIGYKVSFFDYDELSKTQELTMDNKLLIAYYEEDRKLREQYFNDELKKNIVTLYNYNDEGTLIEKSVYQVKPR